MARSVLIRVLVVLVGRNTNIRKFDLITDRHYRHCYRHSSKLYWWLQVLVVLVVLMNSELVEMEKTQK